MTPNIFTGKNVIVQGITGQQGMLHTRTMVAYGTTIIAGITPGKGGEYMDDIPVYNAITDIPSFNTINATVIFVPAKAAKSAVLEAVAAKIPLIVCITEHIPVHDMLYIKQHMKDSSSVLIGPNCPGVLIPGVYSLGIVPAHLSLPGRTAIVSRSGTLTYEVMDALTRGNIGQKYVIGIGGDMIRGTNFTECLALFEQDPDVEQVVMIGEIGGTDEIEAADYIARYITKPVYAYIAGRSAPKGVAMGHAGAILGTDELETASAKTKHLKKSGVHVADSIDKIIDLMEK